MSRDPDAVRGVHLHFDCASGAAGDMTLGAMIDLGVPERVIRDVIVKLGVDGDRLQVRRVVKSGVSAVDVVVRVDDLEREFGPERPMSGHSHDRGHSHGHEHSHEHSHDHSHSHDHDHSHGHEHSRDHGHKRGQDGEHRHGHSHDHRHYRDIAAQIRAAELDPEVTRRALDIFERVARAEAAIHGTTVADVAFHEVGAIDSIVDIVGTAAALAWLDPPSVSAAAVAVGHGTVHCAHGVMPVPAPATLEILREAGAALHSGGLPRELCTPTGAAILASAVTEWTPMPVMTPLAIGYGAGDANLRDRANVLRVTAGRRSTPGPGAAGAAEGLVRIEANIDDMSAELCEHAASRAFAAGAVDVWWTGIVMKKGRPALQLSALAEPGAVDAVIDAVLAETTTIGVRFDPVARRVLDRDVVEVDTPYGRLPVKVARDRGRVINAAPEYEPCRRAAEHHRVPLKRVFAAALARFESAGDDAR